MLLTEMKKIFLFIVLLVFPGLCFFAQSSIKEDSINFFVNRLNWNSFGMTGNYINQVFLNEEAEKLTQISVDSIERFEMLLKEIEIEERTVSVHLILSKIFEPQKKTFKQSNILSVNGSDGGFIFSYNGLSWKFDVARKQYSISQNEILKIKKYWGEKLLLLSR